MFINVWCMYLDATMLGAYKFTIFICYFWLILLSLCNVLVCLLIPFVCNILFHSLVSNLSQSLFFPFIFISWRLTTLQYCSGFCHTLTWISHGFTCIPHPDPPSHFPLYPIPLGLPSAPGPSTCLMHPIWAGDLFHHR